MKRSESSIDVVNSSSLESKCRFFSSVQEYFEIKEDIKNILTRVKFIVKTVQINENHRQSNIKLEKKVDKCINLHVKERHPGQNPF